jgi:serine/threonine protein kinase
VVYFTMPTDANQGSSDNDDDGGVVSSSEPVDRRRDRHKHRIKMASIFNFVYPNNIVEKYKLGEVLGQGTFGVVRLCENIKTKEKFALKTILKSKVPDVDLLKSEIEILSEIDHPHIIKLFDVFEDVINVYLVTELCTGGELYDRVVEKTRSPEGHFSEFDAARILRNILLGIRYCHEEKHIVHRDLVRTCSCMFRVLVISWIADCLHKSQKTRLFFSLQRNKKEIRKPTSGVFNRTKITFSLI